MIEFFAWFFQSYLPPMLPAVLSVAVVLCIVLWCSILGLIASQARQKRRRRSTWRPSNR